MTRYALAEHVFVCRNGEHLVLLDLLKDRYWALEAGSTAGLDAVIAGWPVRLSADSGSVQPATVDLGAALEVLRERGLLTENTREGKDATPVTWSLPATELKSEDDSDVQRTGSLWKFLAAAAIAGFVLKVLPLRWVVRRVGNRKASGRSRGTPLDATRVRQLVAAFVHYRVFVFSSKDECLLDSLSLIEFLAWYDVFPDWVFAVQTRPFAAHCWVQQEDLLFNDSIGHVRGYTPIMVV